MDHIQGFQYTREPLKDIVKDFVTLEEFFRIEVLLGMCFVHLGKKIPEP